MSLAEAMPEAVETTKLVPVPADCLMQYVRHVVPLLQPAVDRGGDIRMQDLFQKLAVGDWQLWTVEDSAGSACVAVVTHVAVRPLSKAVQIMYVGGRNIDECIGHLATIEEWARAIGATKIEAVGRKGWKRKLSGYRQEAVILTKDLTHAG